MRPNWLLERALAAPWAIERPSLELILSIAAGERRDIEAVQAQIGKPLDNTRETRIRDGVAVVPVMGPLFRYANLFTELSGATSFDLLALDIGTALANPNVGGVLLEIDSPGGTVNGTSETAKLIAKAAAGDKPVWAWSGGLMASGAYWLGSAAGRIALGDTARAGSIGVVMGVIDRRGRDADAGLHEFVSSNAPAKRPDPTTPDGRHVLQGEVDALAARFVAAVAANRKVDADKVESDFGRGGTLIGSDAVAAGMADNVATFEETLAALAAQVSERRSPGRRPGAGTRAAAAQRKETRMDMDQLRAEHPQLVTQIEAAAATSAVAGERERTTAILGAAWPGMEAQAQQHVADGTPALEAMVAMNKAYRESEAAKPKGNPGVLGAMQADAPKIAEQQPAPSPSGDKVAAAGPTDPRAIAAAARELIATEAAKGRTITAAQAARIVASGQAAA